MALQGQDNPNAAPATAMGTAFAAARPAAAPAQQAARAAAPAAARAGTFSFRELNRLVPAPMGRTPASEVLTKLDKALGEAYEGMNQQFEVTRIPVDMLNTSALNVSILIVAVRLRAQPELGVAFHVLILEGSVDPIAPRFEQINGQNVEITRVVGEARDARMLEVVADYVGRAFPQSDMYDADVCVVPRDFDINDKGAVYMLAANASFAAATELETRTPGFADMNLANASRDETLTVRTAFPGTQLTNAVAQPVRADIAIDLTAVQRGETAQQQLERTTSVARVNGFLDLIWDPTMPTNNPYAPYQGGIQPNQFQRYATRFVMTNMEMLAASTLPMQLMALVTSLALRDNNNWVQAFRPQPFSGMDIDMRDIGAIGIEANFEGDASGYGKRVDTKADNFKPDSLAKLLAAVVKPGLVLSLDVDEAGPATWYNGVFAAAAEVGPSSERANAIILEAADYLTNGEFRKFFQGGRVAVDENNRIHLGYYTDRNGVKRDIRDIDYLAVLNLMGEKDPNVVRDWSDTFQSTRYPLPQRLAGRLRILKGLFSDVVITGFARRVTFEAHFIDALEQACQSCGLDVRAVTPYSDLGSYERATAQFTGSTLLSAGSGSLFSRSGPTYAGGYTGGANRPFGAGRW